ncbi:ferredoxin [Elizabethkingia argentiflava]|uniref:Ferredoxin n=1 Tax=Elizabethkingia argenteiflava TaxID=2681556 RepID=A0A845PR16_9FLAO|nr:ferredoxin [Elizabethkingia argenteiflava]NAW50284.1 ferredoxin [Elizabethkingia argenteiflava]
MSDVKINIIDREGTEHEIMAPTDMSLNLMETIRAYELVEEGSFGICGGMLMCASCQCYQLSATPVPEMGEEEEALLYSDGVHVKQNSRLSCQIPVTEELEGLKIEIAPEG